MSRKTKVTCAGGTLTASFAAAHPPLIWRFDLERNHSFTLALQGDSGGWELGVTSPKGDFYPIAHFAAREDADEAFAKVERALSGHRRGMGIIAKAVLVLMIGSVVTMTGVAAFGYAVTHRGQSTPIDTATAAPAVSGMQEGVPLPADDVLKPPP